MLREIRTKAGQFVERTRRTGLRHAIELMVHRAEIAIPTMKDLTELKPPRAPLEPGLELTEVASEAQMDGYEYPLASRRTRGRMYIRRGYSAIAVVRDGVVLGDIWCATETGPGKPHPHPGWFGFHLGTDGIYLFDLFVLEDVRKAVSMPFLHHALKFLAQRGYTRAYGYYDRNNIPALWFHRMLGYKEFPPVVLERFLVFDRGRKPTAEELARKPEKPPPLKPGR
jgi:GNAT superfamily N-acetyltransferase